MIEHERDNRLKDRDWKTITPEALTASIEHIRKMFEEAVFKCTWPTQNLCFEALHPDDKLNEKLIDLAEHQAFFRQYKIVIGPAAAQEFDRTLRIGTPPRSSMPILRRSTLGFARKFADSTENFWRSPWRMSLNLACILLNGQKHI